MDDAPDGPGDSAVGTAGRARGRRRANRKSTQDHGNQVAARNRPQARRFAHGAAAGRSSSPSPGPPAPPERAWSLGSQQPQGVRKVLALDAVRASRAAAAAPLTQASRRHLAHRRHHRPRAGGQARRCRRASFTGSFSRARPGPPRSSPPRPSSRAAAAAGVARVVIITSASVYGAQADNPVPLDEAAPLRAVPDGSGPGRLLEIEALIARSRAAYPGLAVTVLRPATLVGSGEPSLVSRHFEAPRLLVVRGSTPRWQFVHVDDLAAAVALAVSGQVTGDVTLGCDGLAVAGAGRGALRPAPGRAARSRSRWAPPSACTGSG